MVNDKSHFYTYLWLREDGTPYYAGKGLGNRAFSNHRRCKRPKDPDNILVQEFLSEEDALEGEKLLIAIYGRKDLSTGSLINRTDGGEGIAGLVHTKESRERMSVSKRNMSSETREKMSIARKGKNHPNYGKTIPLETREKIRLSLIGHEISEDTRRKISSSLLGSRIPLEVRKKMSLVKQGIPPKCAHQRWHVNRGIVNPSCSLCQNLGESNG